MFHNVPNPPKGPQPKGEIPKPPKPPAPEGTISIPAIVCEGVSIAMTGTVDTIPATSSAAAAAVVAPALFIMIEDELARLRGVLAVRNASDDRTRNTNKLDKRVNRHMTA
jgi:hypothetical protein